MLKAEVAYEEPGSDFFEKIKPEQYRRYLFKRLESLGFTVKLNPKDAAA